MISCVMQQTNPSDQITTHLDRSSNEPDDPDVKTLYRINARNMMCSAMAGHIIPRHVASVQNIKTTIEQTVTGDLTGVSIAASPVWSLQPHVRNKSYLSRINQSVTKSYTLTNLCVQGISNHTSVKGVDDGR